MKLEQKRILITGGTSGIGLELVRQLSTHNEIIIISQRATLPNDLPQPYKPISLYHADLSNRSALEEVVDTIQKEFDSIDVLINNAAVQYTPHFLDDDFNFDGIQREIDINFTSVCQLSYLMLPLLEKAVKNRDGKAVILNVNSGLALAPKTSSAIYCATKAALNSFSQSLSYQLENTNISVQQAFLPLVDTAMTKGRGKGKLSADRVASDISKGIEANTLYNYIGKAKILNVIMRLVPSLGRRIMRAN